MFLWTSLPRPQVLSNLYVALSRSSGRETIQPLCDFEEDLFKQSHDTALMDEDDRLEELNQITERWWREMGRKYAEPQE
jgi:hypothetical protein